MTTFNATKAGANTYRGTLKGTGVAPVTFADEVQSTIATSDGDNDVDSVLTEMDAATEVNTTAIRKLGFQLGTFRDLVDPEGYVAATQAQADVGYGYEVRHGAIEDNRALTIVAANVATSITQAVSTTFSIFIRVPAGVDPERILVDHHRGSVRQESYPRINVDDWERITPQVTNAARGFDYYQLVDDNFGNPVGISGVVLGDRFDVRIHPEESTVDRTRSISSFDTLPVPSAFAANKVIYVKGGKWYRNVGSQPTSDFVGSSGMVSVTGSSSETDYGYSSPTGWDVTPPNLGASSFNPNGRVQWLTLEEQASGSEVKLGFSAPEWDAIPGIADLTHVTARVASLADPSQTQDIVFAVSTELRVAFDAQRAVSLATAWTLNTRPLFTRLSGEFTVQFLSTANARLFSAGVREWHEIDAEVYAAVYNRIADGVPDSAAVEAFAELPPTADYNFAKTILVEGSVYELTASTDDTITAIGQLLALRNGSRGYGVYAADAVVRGSAGSFTHNPVSAGVPAIIAIDVLAHTEAADDEGLYVNAVISQAAALAALGSDAVATGQIFTFELQEGSTTSTLQLVFTGTVSTWNNEPFLHVSVATAGYFGSETPQTEFAEAFKWNQIISSRDEFSIKIWSGRTKRNQRRFQVIAKGWTLRHDTLAASNAGRISELEENEFGAHERARLQAVEERTSAIDFDDQTAWMPVTNPGGNAYGKFIVVVGGDNQTNYEGLDYDSNTLAFEQQWRVAANVDNVGFAWVISNAPTWNRLRLAIRDAAGEIRDVVSLSGFQAVPQGIVDNWRNVPAHGFTGLWTSSEHVVHSIGRMNYGDTVTIEEFGDVHVPVWNGELGAEVSFQLHEDAILVGTPEDGQQFQMYRYGDYRSSNKPTRVSLPQAGNIPGDEIHGVAFDRSTGDAYYTYHSDANDNEQLIRFDPLTGAVLWRGAMGYGKDALNDATLGASFTPRALTISDDGQQAWLSVGSIQSTTVYTSIHPINLTTGVIGAKVHQAQAKGNSTRGQYYGLAITPDGLIACDREDMYRINTATGVRTKLNTAARVISGHFVDSMAYSPVWHELIGWSSEAILYRWNAVTALFERISADTPLITSGAAFYSLAFATARSSIQRAFNQTLVDGSVLIGRTSTLPTAAGSLTASVTISLTWTPSGGLGITVGGTGAHPAHELRIPKVLPPRYRQLRIDAEVDGIVTHRFYLPIGGTSDDANDVHSVHDIYISNNQRLETDLEHYRNQPYDGLRIEGTGTSLPASTTIAAYAV